MKLPLFMLSLTSLICSSAFAANNTAQVNVFNYATTSVTTGAAVIAVSSSTTSTSKIEVCDTSGKQIVVSAGASGSAVNLFTVQANGCLIVPYYTVPGTQFNLQAIDATASSGYNLMSFIP